MNKKELYKLNRTIWRDDDDYLTDEHWFYSDSTNIYELYARKGQIFEKIDVNEENFDSLSEEYPIEEDCEAIYISPTVGTVIFVYNDYGWFDKVVN